MNHRTAPVLPLAAALLCSLSGLAPTTTAAAPRPDAAPPAPPAAPAADAQPLKQDLREIIAAARDKVFPALVNIHVVTVEYWSGKETKSESVGSGTIISPEGHILTNAHVVSNGKKFKVTLADKQEISAVLVGEDPATDLAVLKLNPEELKGNTKTVPVATIGDSDQLQVGDYVLAMGSPFSLSRSVTLGIASNVSRVFVTSFSGGSEVDEVDRIDGQRTGMFTNWIQHDALINPGNSGGPLVNLQGEVIGVNTRGGNGMGFASPSNLARSIADRLIKNGEVARSYLGVSFRQLDKSGLKEGVLVTSVAKNTPAARAGLQAGDVIVMFDGRPINVRFAEEIPPLTRFVADKPIGTVIKVAYLRRGETKETDVTTEKLLRDRGDRTALRGWGLAVEEITDLVARENQLDSREGIWVTAIRGGGPAALAEPALQPGDVINAVGGDTVEDLKSLVERYRVIMAQDPIPEFLTIQFDRRGKNQVTLIKPRPDKPEDPPREAAKAWVGVATQPVLKELAEQLGGPQHQGFRVTRVYPRTLAAASDLKVGDIITAVNGDKVQPRGMQDAKVLDRAIRKLKIEEQAKLTVLRGSEPAQITVTLERTRIGPEEARRDENKDFELSVREITFFDRDDNRWDETVAGVLVVGAERGGWAGLGGMFSGDLIQRINDKPVTDLATYRKVMAEITKAQPERVTFVVLNRNRTSFRFVEPEWKPTLEGEKKPADAAPPTPAAGR